MVCVHQIEFAPGTPRLEVLNPQDAKLLVFDGERKAERWPSGGLAVKRTKLEDDLFQFYQLAPGALAYREELIAACDDFYWIASQHSELLQVRCGEAILNVINIIAFMEPLQRDELGYETGTPCNVISFYAPIFKIRGRPPMDLYCLSGLTNPMNEFKPVYDHYKFKGLTFPSIWTEKP